VAIASIVLLITGVATVLLGTAWFEAGPWYSVLRGVILISAVLATVSLWAGAWSLHRHAATRTPSNYGRISLAILSLILVVTMTCLWSAVENAFVIWSLDGRWALTGRVPATGVAGTVTLSGKAIQSYPFIDAMGVRNAGVSMQNGCFIVSAHSAREFGVFAPGYQKSTVPIGGGYFEASVNLRQTGETEPSNITLTKISLTQYISSAIACNESTPFKGDPR
jgi:hypothetical protein